MKPFTSESPRVLVCQHGARHRYTVPRLFEEANMLAGLYTDSSEYSILGKYSKMMGRYAPIPLQRLARRKLNRIPKTKVFSSDKMYYTEFRQHLLGRTKRGMHLYYQRHKILSREMIKEGLQGADFVYSMYHENLDFIRWAKEQGARSVVDVFISPMTDQVMENEYRLFPDWAVGLDITEIELKQRLWNETAKLADILLCPSEWVADGVRTIAPQEASKIRIVPYGCSVNYQGRINNPIKGRVFFAGEDALRKGLHYLGQAVTLLKPGIPKLDVRIAGSFPENIVNHKICKDLHFLGKLSSIQMKEEYLSTEVFVLPSLSEGFAGVVAEAIAAGCPVIVTKEAGSPIIHGREGLIIPSKDVNSIVHALLRMIGDSYFRNQCSKQCLKQTSFYSEPAWFKRLIEAIT